MVFSADADDVNNVVKLGVAIGSDTAQAELDARYGEGVVELVPELRPVEPSR